jgi:tetratricopeptide (TPR) repeat protein
VALLAVAILAGAVRFGYIKGYQDSPFAETPLGESAANVNLAESIANSGTLGEEPYAGPPLYPALLSLLSGAGGEAMAYRTTQAVAGVAIACLVFWGGALLLGTAGGFVAGLLCALYGPLLHFETQFVPAVLLTLLFTSYWLVCIAASRRSLPLWLIAGLLAGAMAGVKNGALALLLPAIVLAVAAGKSRGRRAAASAVILLILGAIIATSPLVIHNWRAGEPGIGIAANCGAELYKANNPHATGLPPGLAGESSWWRGYRYSEVEAVMKSGRELSAAGVSRFWAGQAARYVLREPGDFLGLLVHKLGLFWSRHEHDAGPSQSFVAGNWIPWAAPLMNAFAALGSISLAALLLLRKQKDRLLLAFPLIGALLLAMVYTAPAAVRLLALPSTAVLSSAALLALFERARKRRLAGTAWTLVLLLLGALAVNLAAPRLSGVTPSAANDERLLGVAYEIQGKGDMALAQYDRAKSMAPRSSQCRLSLGAMLASDGVADEAERQFLTAAALDTLSAMPHLGLANLYRRNGLLEQSLAALQAALERAPYDVGLAISLGRSCVDMGLFEQAERHFRNALEIDPENVSAIDGLIELRERGVHLSVGDPEGGSTDTIKGKIQRAMALLREGRMDTSRALLDEALESAPGNLDVVFADATWHLSAGQPEEAIEGYELCLESSPGNAIVMNNLAAAYQQTGRTDDAVAMWKRILELDPTNAKARANLRRVEAGEAPQ